MNENVARRYTMKRRTWALLAAATLILGACATDDDGGAEETTIPPADVTTTAADVTETTMAEEAEPTTTAAEEMMDGVHASDSDLGTILVNTEGFTLYVFTNDTDGESTCYDGCADLWPPVAGDTPIGSDLDASLFGTTARTDGTEQLTVNGQPLYLYTPDTAPGDTTGQAFNGVWFVVGVDGNMIGGPEAAADPVPTEDDLDY
jgi:predicted lipoprotein with Yx(FWY)xxD motif